jgi:hypothetical protein
MCYQSKPTSRRIAKREGKKKAYHEFVRRLSFPHQSSINGAFGRLIVPFLILDTDAHALVVFEEEFIFVFRYPHPAIFFGIAEILNRG